MSQNTLPGKIVSFLLPTSQWAVRHYFKCCTTTNILIDPLACVKLRVCVNIFQVLPLLFKHLLWDLYQDGNVTKDKGKFQESRKLSLW